MRGEDVRRRPARSMASLLGRGREGRRRGGSEQEEEEDEGEGEEARRRPGAGAGGEAGGRCTLCHCPSTHGSGAGRAVEVLGGWGMLMWVPGEGARVGETPPACLTTPPACGDPDVTEAAGLEEKSPVCVTLQQDCTKLQIHITTSSASLPVPFQEGKKWAFKSGPEPGPCRSRLACSSRAGGLETRRRRNKAEPSSRDRCCFSRNRPNPAVPEWASLFVFPPFEAGVTLLECKRAAAVLSSFLSGGDGRQ